MGDGEMSKRELQDAIISLIRDELGAGDKNIANIEKSLKTASRDDLERTYDAFSRFGVKNILNAQMGANRKKYGNHRIK